MTDGAALNTCLQDHALNEMRHMIRTLQEDCKSLASALTQASAGADMATVLQTLPPNLVQVRLQPISSMHAMCTTACMPT